MKEKRDCVVQIQCDSIPAAKEIMNLIKHIDFWISVLPEGADIQVQVCVKIDEGDEED